MGTLLALFTAIAICSVPTLQDTKTEKVKVMTYNIRYGTARDGENAWPNRKEALFAQVREELPDVLGLQEALSSQLEEFRTRFPEYEILGVGRDNGIDKGEFSPLLVKRGVFGVLAMGTQWISAEPNKIGSKGPGANLPRIFTWAKLQHKSGKTLVVVNTHLDHESPEARLLGAKLISEFGDTQGAPKVVMGDFNCEPSDAPVKKMVESGYTLLRDSSAKITFTGFKAELTEGAIIDHIFVKGNLSAGGSRVGFKTYVDSKGVKRTPSDHYPVIAEITL
jgi:endonuclease/exonuclease/phosphatase family metal-dependent hydrolase